MDEKTPSRIKKLSALICTEQNLDTFSRLVMELNELSEETVKTKVAEPSQK
jgi:hypothetical protein